MIWAGIKVVWALASRGLLALWRMLPPKVWAVLIGTLVLVIYHLVAVHNARTDGQKQGAAAEREAWTAKERARLAAQKKADEAAQAQLDALAGELIAAQLDVNRAEEEARQAKAAHLAALNQRAPNYVSALQYSRCPDVPRGYLVLRADAAAFANGAQDAGPPVAAGESLDARSGVSLAPVAGLSLAGPFLSDTDIAQAAAFREVKRRLDEERQAADRLRAACTATISILKGAAP